jgi:predicted transposase YbfD/YdcC
MRVSRAAALAGAVSVIRGSGFPPGLFTGGYALPNRNEGRRSGVACPNYRRDQHDQQRGREVPSLLAALALVPDPRKPRGRRYPLVFVLAVAAACTLAGAKTFREIGDQAADLPQNVLRDLGGKPHPLRRKVTTPSETRIRTLLHLIDTEILDQVIGGWLRDLADAGRLDGLLTAIAIDGKWLRGVLDGQVKLFAAMLHTEKTVIAQHRIPDDTTETTQVTELLEHADLDGAVVTADAASAQRDTAAHIAGNEEDGGRGSAYFLFVKGNQPKLQGNRARRHQPGQDQTSPADLAKLARGQWGIESVHSLRDTANDEDANTGYAGNGPQAMATLRNLASLLYLSGVTEITRTLQTIARDRNRVLDYLPL